MPRFGLSSNFTAAASPPSYRGGTALRQSVEREAESVALSCLSPDGRSVHSLSFHRDGAAFLESHGLPLQGTTDERDLERDIPAVVETKLPENVQAALAADSPFELICVDGDGYSARPRKQEPDDMSSQTQRKLPLLCLYTSKTAFLLNLGYVLPSSLDMSTPVQGKVISVSEPFESHMLGVAPSTCILRIRPAPQQRDGYATMCTPASMAMLTNEYTLVLYHGSRTNGTGNGGGITTTPLTFGLEALAEGDNLITDFSFCQSNELSLLASMSVLFLKASGAVLGASPILFDGAVVQRTLVKEAVGYLESEIDRLNDPTMAKSKQCRAAQQFIKDAFIRGGSSSKSGSHFVEARVSAGSHRGCSTLWPVQIQGPVVAPSFADPDEQLFHAYALEPFFAKGLVGLAIGRADHGVDFAVLPPTSLLPRFAFEGDEDQMILDDALFEAGVVVERVAVHSDNDEVRSSSVLMRDPVVDTMVHYVSNEGVSTISSNVMQVVSNKISNKIMTGANDSRRGFLSPSTSRSGRSVEEIRTEAWSSAQVSAGATGSVTLVGAVISGDAQLGHVLIARLSNGSMDAINMTESRVLHESSSFFASGPEAKHPVNREATVANDALKAVEASPPLHELVQPLVKQVVDGLSQMGKIVGSSTLPKDITPTELAVAVATKDRCDKEVVLPLQQLKELTAGRMKTLKDMHSNQLLQVENLKDMVNDLKKRMEATTEKLSVVESKAVALSQRSSSLLIASQALQPTISEAEFAYFSELKKMDAKCAAWEEAVNGLKESSAAVCNSMDPATTVCTAELTPDQVESCNDLLNGQKLLMGKTDEQLNETKLMVQELAALAGLGEADSSAIQVHNRQQ